MNKLDTTKAMFLSIPSHILAVLLILFSTLSVSGQGLEGIIVEEYYVSDAADAVTVFGIPGPPVGSKTYRIYVDLAPEYKLQQIPGFPTNPLQFSTTTGFYNATGAGVSFADNFLPFTFGIGAVPLDTYLSLGKAGPNYAGVPKTDDTNGSIFPGPPPGRLQNTEIPITAADGLVPSTPAQLSVQVLGVVPLDFVNTNGGGSSIATNGILFNLDGTQGILPENKILIAQLTTDGELSFCINLQIFSSVTLLTERYTHTTVIDFDPILNPGESVSVVFPGLCYPAVITGCTSATACNFLAAATVDDGSCIEPIENCQICNTENNGLVIVDSDNDLLCDAEDPCPFLPFLINGDACTTVENEEGIVADCVCVLVVIPGCTSATACNFEPEANQNDGSCIEPVENCWICNEDNTDLVIVDTNGNGICDADEIEGCTDPNASNYNPLATVDDGSCLFPAEVSLGSLDCEPGTAVILQVTGASTTPNGGGTPVAETRTIYAFAPDNGAGVPTYTGAIWPYVVVPNGFVLVDAEISATVESNAQNILTINGWPAYQYTGDLDETQANGLFGSWSYFESDGNLSQDACVVGLTEVDFENGFSIYPNPTSGELHIRSLFEKFSGEDVQVTIFNILGAEVHQSNLKFTENGQVLSLNLVNLKNGVYLIHLSDSNFRSATRFIKVN